MRPGDLKTEYLGTPNPGQSVRRIGCGVRVTHIPTRLVVECDSARSQYKNKLIAVSMIELGLIELGWKDES